MDAKNDLATDTVVGRPGAPWRLGVYGAGGVGKTTFASRCPDVYFLPTEDGVSDVPVAQYKERIGDLDTLRLLLERLRDRAHPYRAVCLDTLGATETLMVAAIERRLRAVGGKGPRTIAELNEENYGAGYVALAGEWRDLLARLDQLRERRGMRVILVAHAKTELVQNLEGKDYQRTTIDLLSKRSTKMVVAWLDYLLFARQDVRLAPQGKKIIALCGERSIYARQTAVWEAKARGALPWPERMPLDWDTFEFVRDAVAVGGARLPIVLRERLETGLATVDPVRAEAARAAMTRAIEGCQWHVARAICEQAEDEATGPAATVVAAAGVG